MKIAITANNKAKIISQRGNAMIYVLVALALFGFLTLTLSKQNDQADGQDLSDEMAALYANELMSYTAAVQQAVNMLLASGSEVSDLDFVIPSDAAFNTPPHYHKVFHPQGGGLNFQAKFNEEIETLSDGGWFIQNTKNVEWTPTASNDVVLMAWRIKREVCEKINKQITGSNIIPTLSVDIHSIFIGSGNTLNATTCPNCVGYPSLCISNPGATFFGYYSIIAGQ